MKVLGHNVVNATRKITIQAGVAQGVTSSGGEGEKGYRELCEPAKRAVTRNVWGPYEGETVSLEGEARLCLATCFPLPFFLKLFQ